MQESKEFNLVVAAHEIEVISAALVELPFKIAHSLISKLQGQINEQVAKAGEKVDAAIEKVGEAVAPLEEKPL